MAIQMSGTQRGDNSGCPPRADEVHTRLRDLKDAKDALKEIEDALDTLGDLKDAIGTLE